MKKLLSVIVLACSTLVVFAQERGKISGEVIDDATNQPVEFANVALIDPATGKPVDGAMCDDKGKFTINKIAPGTYDLEITFVGYETVKMQSIVVTDKATTVGPIKLGVTAKVLNEVSVEAQKDLIEERVDRTIYNAENDATTRGGDATDVLKRVPMLSVDLDGNVSMRGNSNIRVLINNKPSTIAASSVADALKQIPADQIKSVEVITSPSAKYDAEGSAGIINIITKKNNLQGATLNIDSGIGTRGSNLGLNGNLRGKKMGFSLGGWGRASYNVKGNFENTQITGDQIRVQKADTRNNNIFGRYQLGWDYDINKNNFMTASVRYGIRNGHNYQDGLTTEKFATANPGVLTEYYLQDSKTTDNSGTVDINLDYTHTYEKPQKELSFSAQFSKNNRKNNFLNSFYNASDFIDSLRRNDNRSYNQEVTLQFDYQTPIKTNQMLEFGAKEIMRTVSSEYQSFDADSPNGPFTPISNAQSPSNVFNYDQNVMATYLSYTYTSATAYSFKVGTRYEYTNINANFANPEGGTNPEIPSYGVMVPSINVSRKLKNGNMVKAAYNRRIQRPSIQFLNPNVQVTNSLSISRGNPNLDPEYTNNYELSYNTFIKGSSLNFSGFVRNTTGAIQSVRNTLDGGVIETTYQNIGVENAYGMSVFASVNIGKLMINGGTDFFYAMLNNQIGDAALHAENEGWVFSGRLFGNYNLTKGWGIQAFSFYRGRQVQLQGTQGGFYMYSIGVKKDLGKDKRGSIGFGAENFLQSAIKIKNEINTPTISQRSVNEMRNMSFRVNFSYRIGKMGFDQKQRRKRSVNNDDLKDGGDGGGMDNGGQGGGQGQQQRGGGNTGGAGRIMAPVKPAAPDTTKMDSIALANIVAEGTWNYTVEGGNGTLTIKKENGVYSGTIVSSRNPTPATLSSVTLVANQLTFTYTVSFGGNDVVIQGVGTITGDEMKGDLQIGTFRTMPFDGKRSQ